MDRLLKTGLGSTWFFKAGCSTIVAGVLLG